MGGGETLAQRGRAGRGGSRVRGWHWQIKWYLCVGAPTATPPRTSYHPWHCLDLEDGGQGRPGSGCRAQRERSEGMGGLTCLLDVTPSATCLLLFHQ